MRRMFLKGKIHHAVVIESNLEYEGSMGVDETLLKAVDMAPYEKVSVFNVTNGARFSTYLIKEKADSGRIAVYGAAAHKAGRGDRLIIVSYAQLEEGEIAGFRPKIIVLDGENRIKTIK